MSDEKIIIKNATYPEIFGWDIKRYRPLLILMGGLVMGTTWYIRGRTGFGGSQGMALVGLFMTLYIYLIFNQWKKLSWALIGLTGFLTAITAGGWGTIVGQVTGRLSSSGSATVAPYDIEVSILGGFFWMFSIGFGWAPFLGFFLGRLISAKKYRFRDLLIIILTVIVVDILIELTLAHLAIPLISPDSYSLYADNLANTNPWLDYVSHFRDGEYYESIAGGRNYAAMVSNFSASCTSIGVWAVMRFAYKDKRAARVMILTSLIIGLSIMVADLWQFWGRGGAYDFVLGQETIIPPEWVANAHWPLWEYFTGFLAGLGITALVLFQNPSVLQKSKEVEDTLIPPRGNKFLILLFTYFYLGIFTFFSPLGRRLGDMFPSLPNFTSVFRLVFLVGGLIIGGLTIFGVIKLKEWPLKKSAYRLIMILFPLYVLEIQILGFPEWNAAAIIMFSGSVLFWFGMLWIGPKIIAKNS